MPTLKIYVHNGTVQTREKPRDRDSPRGFTLAPFTVSSCFFGAIVTASTV